jgi:hypothetical protein
VAQDILFGANPPPSGEEARAMLERRGMVPLERGKATVAYGFTAERRKWWQFWKA